MQHDSGTHDSSAAPTEPPPFFSTRLKKCSLCVGGRFMENKAVPAWDDIRVACCQDQPHEGLPAWGGVWFYFWVFDAVRFQEVLPFGRLVLLIMFTFTNILQFSTAGGKKNKKNINSNFSHVEIYPEQEQTTSHIAEETETWNQSERWSWKWQKEKKEKKNLEYCEQQEASSRLRAPGEKAISSRSSLNSSNCVLMQLLPIPNPLPVSAFPEGHWIGLMEKAANGWVYLRQHMWHFIKAGTFPGCV